MDNLYLFIRGPLALAAFAIFLIGIAWRVVWYVRGLDWRLDRVAYKEKFDYGIKGALRSLVHWMLPLNYTTMSHPLFMGATYFFHFCIFISAIFLSAHVMLIEESWGISWYSIPDTVADYMTVAVIAICGFFFMRRLTVPYVKAISTRSDFLVLAIAAAPFITGFLAYHQVMNYKFWLILHILSGEAMLVAIPFTKLSHFVLFFCSRVQIGMDYGIKRGGQHGKGIVW